MKKVSTKRAGVNREYSKLRKEFLKENPCCKGKFVGCTGCTEEYLTIHHKKGRGKYMLDVTTWVTLCYTCHQHIHDKLSFEEAEALGLRIKKD